MQLTTCCESFCAERIEVRETAKCPPRIASVPQMHFVHIGDCSDRVRHVTVTRASSWPPNIGGSGA